MTPESINDNVTQILKTLKAEYEPEYVILKEEPGYAELDCFMNVAKKVGADGGRIIYGWTIWEHKYFIEAEFHTVWENENLDLLDVTPRSNSASKILFVPDDRIVYQGKQIQNVRLNTSKKPLVDQLIRILDAYFKITNSGKLAYENDDITFLLSPQQTENIQFLKEAKNIALVLLAEDGSDEDLCKCGSGKKFKNCHGKDLRKVLKHN